MALNYVYESYSGKGKQRSEYPSLELAIKSAIIDFKCQSLGTVPVKIIEPNGNILDKHFIKEQALKSNAEEVYITSKKGQEQKMKLITIAEKIDQIRRKSGLNKSKFSDKIGVDYATLWAIENKGIFPRKATIQKLSDFAKVSYEEFMKDILIPESLPTKAIKPINTIKPEKANLTLLSDLSKVSAPVAEVKSLGQVKNNKVRAVVSYIVQAEVEFDVKETVISKHPYTTQRQYINPVVMKQIYSGLAENDFDVDKVLGDSLSTESHSTLVKSN